MNNVCDFGVRVLIICPALLNLWWSVFFNELCSCVSAAMVSIRFVFLLAFAFDLVFSGRLGQGSVE
jgi:hypothetical protein